jgi:hypothetical protein
MTTLSKLSKGERRTQKASPYNTHHDKGSLPIGEQFKSQKFYILLSYLVLFHFYPIDEKHFAYLYIDLQEHIKKNHYSFWLLVLLENKDYFLQWLVEQETISENAFFGNICSVDALIGAMNSITIRFEEEFHRPKRVLRHRGYRDKGSLPTGSSRIIAQEESSDIFLQLAEYQREEKKKILQGETNLLRLHFSEGRDLPSELLVKFRFKKGVILNETVKDIN